MLAQAEESLDEAARIGRGEEGTLDVGFVSSAITLGVPERIQAFRQRYPAVHTRLHEGQTAVTVARLLRGEVDLGIVRDAEPAPGLDAATLATEGYVAVLPASHPHARRRRLDAAVLRDEPFVLYPRTAGELAHRRNLQPCADAGYEPDIVQEATNWVTVFHLVSAGVGVTIAPASAGRHPPGVRRQRPARERRPLGGPARDPHRRRPRGRAQLHRTLSQRSSTTSSRGLRAADERAAVGGRLDRIGAVVDARRR